MAASLEGFAELSAQLKRLKEDVRAKVLRNSVAAAIRPALNQAKATIPVGTEAHKTYKGRLVGPGFASRNLKIVSFASRDDGSATAVLGVRREAFYAVQFVELGTAKMPARPWLVPAYEATKDQQIERLGTALKERIAKAIARGR